MRTHVRAMALHAPAFARLASASAALVPAPHRFAIAAAMLCASVGVHAQSAQTDSSTQPVQQADASVAVAANTADNPTAAQLKTTVVTASRTEQKLADTLAATSVITREDIERSQAQDLPTLLRGQAGVEIVQNGGFGTSASIFMRGAASNASLVLIDGVPVNSATSGTTNIAQIPVSQIDHIEIVRGNVSALYGSQAVGGVIQIFTRKGDGGPPRAYAEVGYGTNNTTQANAGIAGSFEDGKTRFSLDVSRFHTNGISAQDPRFAPKVNPNRNGDDNTSVTASLSRKFGDTWEAGVRLFQSDGSSSYDNAFGKPTDLNDTDARVRQISGYMKGNITDKWSTRFTVTQGDDYSYNYLNGKGNGNFHTSSNQIDWANEYAFMPDQKLIAGYTRLEQTVESNTNYGRNNRHLDSPYLGYEGTFGKHQVQANVRRDVYSDFGGANSYWLGYGYNLTNQWKFMANASDGFRAPTFNELFYPGYGNPNLQPERSISKELAVQFNGGERLGLVKLTGFQTNYTNLIQSLTVFPYTAANVAKARVEGLELTYAGRPFFGVDVRASFTRQNPTDLDADKQLARRAKQFGSIGLSKTFDKFTVGGDVFYSGERYDTGGQHLGAYTLVNLQARYDIDKSWYVSAHLDNVFNKNYQTVYAYNTLGRAIYVSLGWKQF
ncbi:TonB-dependent receptor plug domain-containing protein [Pandoraea apista]|uniref:TonB-dependent receptor plug domain-containing protein n=1 Tax=Pandoraea apista TaxID=93218 RepID=UPI000658B569|nr:TonB-dependent receptor [Pandoraea apista]AVF39915.1 TonB-dependent receptor [Pandoraea apista]RRW90281.1 TonB-dependent receptor [Pandoraea apista]RRX00043.1 TonB-dependent receptor [Pandoraea apista]CFB65755.1 Vitamin B12 transporter BtuB precursor [Pandoraea apista]